MTDGATAGRAAELQAWLESLGLANRVLNPLRRELEVVRGKREAGEVIGTGTVLRDLGREEFAAELYRDGGGRLTELPNVGGSAITALRAVIPAPASVNGAMLDGEDVELPRPPHAPPAPATAPPETAAPLVAPDEAAKAKAAKLLSWLETLPLSNRVLNSIRYEIDVNDGGILIGMSRRQFAIELYRTKSGGKLHKLQNVGLKGMEELRAAIPRPEPAKRRQQKRPTVPATADEPLEAAAATPEPPAAADEPLEAAAAIPEPPAADTSSAGLPDDAPLEVATAAPEPPANPEAPRRRGRPPRGQVITKAPDAAPAPKPSRRPRSDTAGSDAPRAPQRVSQRTVLGAAQQAELRAPQRAEHRAPTLAPVASPDPSFVAFLKLWHELHPQGQRAAMQYMTELLTSV